MTTSEVTSRRTRGLWRSAVVTVLSRGASTLALVALTPLLTRQLGVEAFGVLVTLASSAMVIAVADLGVANGLVARLAAEDWGSAATRAVLSAAGLLLLSATALASLAAVVLALWLPWPALLKAASVPGPTLRWCVFFAVLGAALTLTAALGQKLDLARQRGHINALWNGVAGICGPAAAIAVANARLGLAAVVAAWVLVPAAVLALQTVHVIRSLPGPMRPSRRYVSASELRRTGRTGLVYFCLAVVMSVAFRVDALIVSSVLGASAAAHFGIVTKLFGAITVTFCASTTQLWSAFADALRTGEVAWTLRVLRRTTLVGVLTGIGAGVALVPAGPMIIEAWFGAEFRPSTGLLLAAASWTTYLLGIQPLAMLLNGAQLHVAQVKAAIPMGLLNISLSIGLTHVIGSAGPLIGSLLAHLVCVGIPLGLLARRTVGQLAATRGQAGGVSSDDLQD